MKKWCGHGGTKSFLVQTDILNYHTQDFDYHPMSTFWKFIHAAAQKPIQAHAVTSVNGSVCGFVFHGEVKTSRSTQCGSASVFFDPLNSLVSFWLILHHVSDLHLSSAESLMTTPGYISACSCELDFLFNLNVSTRIDHDPISWSLVVWPLSRVMGCYNRRCARSCVVPYQWSSIILTGLSN